MNYGKIFYCDIANGIGIRTSFFVSGCRNHCEGCFNPETWDFSYGKRFDRGVEDELIKSLQSEYTDGISILGGEPMEPENQKDILHLIKRIREECPKKTIWVYSGFTYEELTSKDPAIRCVTEYTEEILKNIDILVDGKFVLARKNISLRFRGSSNQRIIDVPASLAAHDVVLSEYM
jgi:anaerobic ribonucleoside-triphosphate reductase activating protein